MTYKPTKYIVLQDRIIRGEVCAKQGDIVYDQAGYDYGLSSDDTRATGIEHVTVTKNEDGSYPGFTIPEHHLKEL